MSDEENIQRVLPVQLTVPERDERGRQLSQAWDDYEVIEEEKKAVSKNHTKALRDKRAEISKLSRMLKVGTDNRVVTCRWVEDFTHNVTRLVRQDNGGIVEERALKSEERQLAMNDLDA